MNRTAKLALAALAGFVTGLTAVAYAVIASRRRAWDATH